MASRSDSPPSPKDAASRSYSSLTVPGSPTDGQPDAPDRSAPAPPPLLVSPAQAVAASIAVNGGLAGSPTTHFVRRSSTLARRVSMVSSAPPPIVTAPAQGQAGTTPAGGQPGFPPASSTEQSGGAYSPTTDTPASAFPDSAASPELPPTWPALFESAGLPDEASARYAALFAAEEMPPPTFAACRTFVDNEFLAAMGVSLAGHRARILGALRISSAGSGASAQSPRLQRPLGLQSPVRAGAALELPPPPATVAAATAPPVAASTLAVPDRQQSGPFAAPVSVTNPNAAAAAAAAATAAREIAMAREASLASTFDDMSDLLGQSTLRNGGTLSPPPPSGIAERYHSGLCTVAALVSPAGQTPDLGPHSGVTSYDNAALDAQFGAAASSRVRLPPHLLLPATSVTVSTFRSRQAPAASPPVSDVLLSTVTGGAKGPASIVGGALNNNNGNSNAAPHNQAAPFTWIDVAGRDASRTEYRSKLRRVAAKYGFSEALLLDTELTLALPQILSLQHDRTQFLIIMRVATETTDIEEDTLHLLTNRWMIAVNTQTRVVVTAHRVDSSPLARLRMAWNELWSTVSFSTFLCKLLDDSLLAYVDALEESEFLLDQYESQMLALAMGSKPPTAADRHRRQQEQRAQQGLQSPTGTGARQDFGAVMRGPGVAAASDEHGGRSDSVMGRAGPESQSRPPSTLAAASQSSQGPTVTPTSPPTYTDRGGSRLSINVQRSFADDDLNGAGEMRSLLPQNPRAASERDSWLVRAWRKVRGGGTPQQGSAPRSGPRSAQDVVEEASTSGTFADPYAHLVELLEAQSMTKQRMNQLLYHLHRRCSVYSRMLSVTQSALESTYEQLSLCSPEYAEQMTRSCGELALKADSLHDNCQNLLNLHLSLVGFRTNELMGILTVFSAFFIPITFIAGVYGMNFTNMPELYWHNGYFYCLGMMGFVTCVVYTIFRRKGLL